jgi:hypothetical protein
LHDSYSRKSVFALLIRRFGESHSDLLAGYSFYRKTDMVSSYTFLHVLPLPGSIGDAV